MKGSKFKLHGHYLFSKMNSPSPSTHTVLWKLRLSVFCAEDNTSDAFLAHCASPNLSLPDCKISWVMDWHVKAILFATLEVN